MGKKQCANAPNISAWDDAGCHFVRFDLTPEANVQIDKIFHDSIVLLAFEGCRWSSASGGASRREAPGSLILRDAGEVFSLKSEGIARTGGICREIHIPTAKLTEILDPDALLPAFDFSNPLIEDSSLAQNLMRAHQLFEQKHCELEASEHFAQLILSVATATSGRTPERRLKTCSRRNAKIISYLRENYHQQISLQEMADVVDMNAFVLIRQFKKELGMSPHEYLQILRVNQAKHYIRLGLRLADVAQSCGFADQSHLTRQFKRRTGLTPGHFSDPRRRANFSHRN